MKESKHKLLTLAALTTIAAGVIHLSNRVIVASSQLKEMLDFSNLQMAFRKNILYKERHRFSYSFDPRCHAWCKWI